LWVWKKTIKGRTPEKEDVNVLVIDSEGLGALDEDSNHDVRIFSLAILLSSYFIYNSMGSIDENALQSLSLVVQLTKHIQIKASGMNHDVDPEEYSRYFPSFMWVVRDFSLQLVDTEGENITSKEYLDKALCEQKGFSESAEQKNRIRRMLRCFFKERDCCTIVRPSTQEEDLQNLEEKDFDSLRDEFKTQIKQLKSKVMKRIKPKTIMNGQKLSGTMFADLVISYVTAINKGAVPNIENAWTYISKGECQKALEKSYDSFCEELTSSFEMHAPLFDYDLQNMYKEAKTSAIGLFESMSVGDVSEEFKKDLKEKMKQKFSQIKAENEKVTRQEAEVFLQNFFAPIEQKLRNQQYEEFAQYEKEVRDIETAFIERGPQGPNREAICQSYIINALSDGAAYFNRSMMSEMKLQQTLSKDTVSKLEERVKELKTDLNSKNEEYENKMRSSENEKAQLIAKEQSMREALTEIKQEKENNEKEWKARLQSEKNDMNRLVDEYKSRMEASEDNAKESQRRMMSTENESEKQKALLKQKVEFLENNITSLKEKEKEYQAEIKNQKKELTSSIKENAAKFEERINELTKKLDDTQDELVEKDNKISELEQKLYVATTSVGEKDDELEKFKKIAEDIENMREQNEKLKEELDENRKTFNSEMQEERDSLAQQVEELTARLAQRDNDFNSEKGKLEKEQMIQQQKIDFLKAQIEERDNKIEENRRTHEAMLKAVQTRESEKEGAIEEADKKIENLKQEHYREMKELQESLEANNKRISDELEILRQSEGDAKMQLKLIETDKDKEIHDLKEALEKAQTERDRFQNETKELENQKQNLLTHTEERYKQKIELLESDLEESNLKSQEEREEQQKKFDQDLALLKQFYEQEKDRLEKKIKKTISDYNQRLQDEQNAHEEELEILQDDLRDKEDQLQDILAEQEHEQSLSAQKIQSLEQHLVETKKALDDVQQKNAQLMDNQMNNFNKERKELLDKADELNQTMTDREKQITLLENRNESLTSDIKKREEEIETLRLDYNNLKKHLEGQVDALREKCQGLSDESMHHKLSSEREEALTQQRIEFLENKNQDLLKALSDSSTKYQDKLDSLKSEQAQEANAKIDKLQIENEKLVQKFDEKKKALKDLEKSTAVQITKLERERAVNGERIENLEKKLATEQEYSKKQIEAMREKINALQDKGSKNFQDIEQKYYDLKESYTKLEKARSELQSKYEKDEALWEGQSQFHSEQKEQLKVELTETKKRLEETIEQLQAKGGRGDLDKKQLAMIAQMEKEKRQEIVQIQENYEKQVSTLEDKIRTLEAQNIHLQEKYELTFRDSSSSTKNLEKKVDDYEQRDAKQQEEIQELKRKIDKMLLDKHDAVDKEKETFKGKLQEIERRLKAVESEKSALKFEIEKQRATFNYEKENFDQTKSDMQETISKLQKRNETLLTQNEKLKEKNKTSKRLGRYGGVNTSTSYLDTSGQGSRFMTGKFLNINKEVDAENYSNNSGKENRFKTMKFIGDGMSKSDAQSIGSAEVEISTPAEQVDGKDTASSNTMSPNHDE
jgi:chromosome segregation ATPase